ncbi:MAG: peptidyl-prolyl cis-trans isomerase, partial [Candidatus Krumholzibacteria bacterium]|nr:peptidyl-prolyl cis-trans isomerase [Candidatus Krumholzibacteria bacterium]
LKVLEIPEVAKDLKAKKERFLVSTMYKDQITDQVAVNELDVKDYYDTHKDELAGPEKRNFSIIVVSDKAKADEVAALAKKGEPFAKLIKNYAEDKTAAPDGNRTGLVSRGEFPDYDAVAFSLAEGAISDPFQVPRGWAIVKVDKIEAPQPLPYASAIATVQAEMKAQQTEALFKEKLASWRKDYPIKIYERNLKKAELKRTRPSDAELEQRDREARSQMEQQRNQQIPQ